MTPYTPITEALRRVWTEVLHCAQVNLERIYELSQLVKVTGVSGTRRTYPAMKGAQIELTLHVQVDLEGSPLNKRSLLYLFKNQ